MPTKLIPFIVLWCLLAVGVLALIVWRKLVASHEDDQIHVLDGGPSVSQQQVQIAAKLEQIDKWGKTLTVITVVYGVLLAAAFIYMSWVNGSQIPLE